ncbi:hypothetical protein ACRRTK_018687 [Alexandromys fortis]
MWELWVISVTRGCPGAANARCSQIEGTKGYRTIKQGSQGGLFISSTHTESQAVCQGAPSKASTNQDLEPSVFNSS